MSLEHPGPEVIRAVHAKPAGSTRRSSTASAVAVVDRNKTVVSDPALRRFWARFYEIETNRPFFCGRDGVKKGSLAEIEAERRNGYAWHGDWGRTVATRFATWSKSHLEGETP